MADNFLLGGGHAILLSRLYKLRFGYACALFHSLIINDLSSFGKKISYSPKTMPPVLLKAHQNLDKAVDKAYRGTAFKSEKERIEFLFELYQKLTEPLIQPEKPKKRRGGKKKP